MALCSIDGEQRLCCGHEEGDGGVWSGEWPGTVECRELDIFARLVPGLGWVPCSRDDEGAGPDLNRLVTLAATGELVWNGARWVKPTS